MKGIILAGGLGTRLYPITVCISKQLLPIYDKPMIYYPLSILMLSGIKDILIITNKQDRNNFYKLFGDGSNLGISIKYIEQPSPDGLAQSFILGKDFIGEDDVCLILGDNIYFGHELSKILNLGIENVLKEKKATIYGYYVKDPQRYGVVEFDNNGSVLNIDEKPMNPKSNYAITGLYFYPNNVVQKALNVKPSKRGELEITSINEMYLREGSLKVEILSRGFTWLDAGTPGSLLEASLLIEAIEKRQGLKIACLEEIAYKKGYISLSQLRNLQKKLAKSDYGKYLGQIISS